MDIKRRFFVTNYLNEEREVFPLNFSKGKYADTNKIDDGQFFFRRDYSGKFLFGTGLFQDQDDYGYFLTYEIDPELRCQKFIIVVKRYCEKEYKEEWRGSFSTGQGFWDLDQCRFEIKPTLEDEYTCILEKLDLETNILSGTLPRIARAFIYNELEFIYCRQKTPFTPTESLDCRNTFPQPTTWQLYFDNVADPGTDYVQIYVRETGIGTCDEANNAFAPIGTGWVLVDNHCAIDGFSSWARYPHIPIDPENNDYIQKGTCGSPDPMPPPPVVELTISLESSTPDTFDDFEDGYVWGQSEVCIDAEYTQFFITEEMQTEFFAGLPNFAFQYDNDFWELVEKNTWDIKLKPLKLGATDVKISVFPNSPPKYIHFSVLITRTPDTSVIRPVITTVPVNTANPSQTGVHYYVAPRVGSSYFWTVQTGTITSGQSTNEIVVDWDAGSGDRLITCKETIDCGCSFLLVAPCSDDGDAPYYWCSNSDVFVEYRNCRLLKDVATLLMIKAGCNLKKVVSDLLDWNPVGDSPGYVEGQNYVTGLPNLYDTLLIMQKSDAILPTATNPATIGNWSLEKFIKFFAEAFNGLWFIQGNTIRFEHVSYITYILGLDLTTEQFYEDTKKSNRYTHITEETPKRETYKWQEALGEDFVGKDIYTDSICVSQDPDQSTKDHVIDDVTTDLAYIQSSPDAISKDGFVVVAAEHTGETYRIHSNIGVLSGQVIANVAMSWANLHNSFHKHFRYWKNGFMNDNATTFVTVRPTIKGDPINIILCCEWLQFDPENQIKTPLGVKLGDLMATVERTEYDIDKDTLRLNLNYPL